MRNKQTAAMALFGLLNEMSNLMMNAGDENYANILKHICNEYAGKTIAMEKEQLFDFFMTGRDIGTCIEDAEEIYNEMYGNANN